MGRCNFCSFQLLKKRAKEEGLKVTLRGNDVFVSPKGVIFDEKNSKDREKYFQAWYMELPTKCYC